MGDVDQLQEAEERMAQLKEQEEREERARLESELKEPPVKPTADHPRSPELVPLDQIELGANIRSGPPEKIENLALSIKQRGLWEPIVVRQSPAGAAKPYQLVAGFRRFAALQLVHADEPSALVRAEVVDGLGDTEIPELQLVENGQRVQLKPMDVARALRLILSENPELSAAAVARSMGLRPDWVRRHFRLLELPAEVQVRLDSGDLSFTVADLLRRAERQGRISEEEVKDLAEQVVAKEVSSQALHELLVPPKPETPLVEAEEGSWSDLEEEARRRELERQADDLLSQAPAPALPQVGDQDVVFGDWSSGASGSAPAGAPGSGSSPFADDETVMSSVQLDGYLLGRVLEELVPDAYLEELGIARTEAYEYVATFEPGELIPALRAVARYLADRDPRLQDEAAADNGGVEDAGDAGDAAGAGSADGE